MVERVNRRGLYDWLAQRVTALFIGIYTVFIIAFLLLNQPISYSQWHTLCTHWIMKLVTFAVILSILWHAWIGLWTVFTDYIKCKYLRMALQTLTAGLLIAYFVWTVDFLWMLR